MKTPVIQERGQGTAEYALLIAIITIVLIAGLSLVHDREIITSLIHLLDSPAPLAEGTPQPETPDQIANRTIDIIDAAAPVAAGILLIYSLMHLRGPSSHATVKTPRRRK